MAPKKTKSKTNNLGKQKSKRKRPITQIDDSFDEDDSSDEEELSVPLKRKSNGKSLAPPKKSSKKEIEVSDDEDSDDEDDSDFEDIEEDFDMEIGSESENEVVDNDDNNSDDGEDSSSDEKIEGNEEDSDEEEAESDDEEAESDEEDEDMEVEESGETETNKTDDDPTASNILYVTNLSFTTTHETLSNLFEDANSIQIAKFRSGKSRGFAFIEFPSKQFAISARKRLNGRKVDDYKMNIAFSDKSTHKADKRSDLIIFNLSPKTTAETLKETFTASIATRVPIDEKTEISKGCGFVSFASAKNARQAIEEYDEKTIDGNCVKIVLAHSRKDNKIDFDKKEGDNTEEGDKRKVQIYGLSADTTKKELQSMFPDATRVHLPRNKESGTCFGFAFVDFKTLNEAKVAYNLSGKVLKGRYIHVTYKRKPPKKATEDKNVPSDKKKVKTKRKPMKDGEGEVNGTQDEKVTNNKHFNEKDSNKKGSNKNEAKNKKQKKGEENKPSRTLMINKLSFNVTEYELNKKFPGNCRIHIVKDRDSGYSKGFGFVEYPTLEKAAEANSKMNGKPIDGSRILIKYAVDKEDPSETLIIRNLSYDTTAETLEAAFPNSTSVRVAMDANTGASRGFGFADFSSVNQAMAARQRMNNKTVDGRQLAIGFFNESQRKNQQPIFAPKEATKSISKHSNKERIINRPSNIVKSTGKKILFDD